MNFCHPDAAAVLGEWVRQSLVAATLSEMLKIEPCAACRQFRPSGLLALS